MADGAAVADPARTPPAEPAAWWRQRRVTFAAYLVLVVGWTVVIGLPSDPPGIALTAWLGTIAWRPTLPWRAHLRFLRDWLPVVILLLVYGVLRGIADQTGVPIRYDYPIRFDEWIGGGTLPTIELQHALCGNPCEKHGPIAWYDVALATVYSSHFIASLTIAAVLWVRDRTEWLRWVKRVLTLWYSGLVVYLVLPTSPPWLASQRGLVEPLAEISSRGWGEIGLHRKALIGSGFPNQVAAMPSLHTGFSCLIAFYAVQRLTSPWRWLALLYPLAMAFTLVYGGDHYVADTLAGALTAGLVLLGWRWWEGRQAGRRRGTVITTAAASSEATAQSANSSL